MTKLNLKPGDLASAIVGSVITGLVGLALSLVSTSSQNTYTEMLVKKQVEEQAELTNEPEIEE